MPSTHKVFLQKCLFILNQFGLDPLRFLKSIRGLSSFGRDWRQFRRNYGGVMRVMPCLNDRFEEGGATKNEYFWQDLLVARWIHAANPSRHVDVGSRVDGFVAHVASYRELEVFDVRPITAQVPGVVFRQVNMMDVASLSNAAGVGGYCDSVSCLHAIEHFGLGRYGDPINASGYQQGIANLAQLLKPGGTLYLSTPIGRERVEFNANWVFDPRTILACAEAQGLEPTRLVTIAANTGGVERPLDIATLDMLAEQHYVLAIFLFRKPKSC